MILLNSTTMEERAWLVQLRGDVGLDPPACLSIRHLELKRLCRDAMFPDAGGIAVATAIGAVQVEATLGGDAINARSAKSGPAAALAFDHLVALLQQALALAIFALLLLLDIGAFCISHQEPPDQRAGVADLIVLALTRGSVPVYKSVMTV
jgi:hypothetical protein